MMCGRNTELKEELGNLASVGFPSSSVLKEVNFLTPPVIACTTPKMAKLSLSVPPLVKIISFARAPRIFAMSSLAVSTALLAINPSLYIAFGLPKFSVQYGSIAFFTRLSIGAAAAWSIYIRFVLIFFVLDILFNMLIIISELQL